MSFFSLNIKWPDVDFAKIVHSSKILVIDDDGFAYEQLFKNEGYNIDVWLDITEFNKIEQRWYDIILLDIGGIGINLTTEEGLGILKHIKKSNPYQIVIAMTNKAWTIDAHSFFELANDRLNKSEDFTIFKEKIDKLLKEKCSKQYYISAIKDQFNGDDINSANLEKYFNRALKFNDPYKVINPYKNRLNKDAIQSITAIIQIAISVFQLLLK